MGIRAQEQELTSLTLQRNVQFLYEAHIARFELTALGCDRIARNDDDWRLFSAHVNGNARLINERSAYTGAIDGELTVYAQLIQPNYQGGRFNRTRSVNQYLTHWIYPYRGKFHPQMVRGLLNILGVSRGSTVAEPYLGSGTAALEASLLGAEVIGVDLSPLCVMLTRVKTRSADAVGKIRKRVGKILESPKLRLNDKSLADDDDRAVAEFLQIARMVTFSDVA